MEPHPDRLAPESTADRVNLPDQWFVLCQSSELRSVPISRTLQASPFVLFRDEKRQPAALLDRCPHRNAPLSQGRVRGELLECGYHGWRFDRDGQCRAIPGLCGEPGGKRRGVPSYAALDQDGFIWVYSTADARPAHSPFRFPYLGQRGYASLRRVFDVRGSLHAALENALDVPHTAVLHGGFFRSPRRRTEIDVVVRRFADRVEAEYIGEMRPGGILGRILSPRAGVVTHVDRFILPSIAQVEYRLGENHLLITAAMTPVSGSLTRLNAVASFKLPLPAWFVKILAVPVATRILRQDAAILDSQSRNIQRFGGEHFTSTEIDLLGPMIRALLQQASNGYPPPSSEVMHEHRVRMTV